MLIHDHPSQPPQGHYFPDPSGFTLRGKTLRELLAAIRTYREANGLPPGSPEREVEALYAVEFPWLISKVGVTPESAEDPVARWLARAWRNPPKEKEFVESEIAKERLAVCGGCPHYAQAHPFSADARRRLVILGAGRVSDYGACKVQHWATGLAALVMHPEAKPVEGCWAGESSSTPTSTR